MLGRKGVRSKRDRKGEIHLALQAREGRSQKVTLNKNLKDRKEPSGLGARCPREDGERVETKARRKHEAGRLKGVAM